MRIVLISPHYHDDSTFTVVMSGLIGEYRRRGHSVDLVAQQNPGDDPRVEVVSGNRIFRVGGSSRHLINGIKTFVSLFRILSGADVAHIHLASVNINVAAIVLVCFLQQVPMGATFQDYNTFTPKSAPRWEKPLLKWFLANCRWITAVSRFTKAEVSADLPSLSDRLWVIPNGHDDPEIEGERISGGRPIVLCVAKLYPYKGIDVLLMAWAEVCLKIKDVDLVICGPDFARGHYHKLAQALGLTRRVKFEGPVDLRRVWSLIDSCLFYAQPSRRESFGIAVLQAMARGKAVLATRCGGLEDLVEDSATGLLVPPQDIAALRDGFLRLMGDSGLRARLGDGARARAAGFHWEKIADSYLNLYAGEGRAVQEEPACT